MPGRRGDIDKARDAGAHSARRASRAFLFFGEHHAMAIGKLLRDRRLTFGALPVNMLDRCNLSPMGRLLWGILDGCGAQSITPSTALLAVRMGLNPESRKTVTRHLRELVDAGFLEVRSGRGHWQTNTYFLTMPDYCFITSPELLKMAQAVPVQANKAGWRAGKGKTAKKPRNALFDRLAWFERETARKAAGRLRRAGTRGVQLDLVAPGDLEAMGLADLTPVGPVDPTGVGPVDPTGVGLAGPTPSKKINKTKVGERINRRNDSMQTTPPTVLEGKTSREGNYAPEGWTSWAARYQDKTKGRSWIWTRHGLQLALKINALLAGNLAQLDQVQQNFLSNDFWGTRPQPWPLEALAKHVNEFLPAGHQAAPAAAHRHDMGTWGTAQLDGILYHVRACDSCDEILEKISAADSEAAQLQAEKDIEAFKARRAADQVREADEEKARLEKRRQLLASLDH